MRDDETDWKRLSHLDRDEEELTPRNLCNLCKKSSYKTEGYA
jgi:hypothetical protein